MNTSYSKSVFVISSFFLIIAVSIVGVLPVDAGTITEIEPNDTLAMAQSLNVIGHENSLSASIGEPGDIDWYQFGAVAGRTYVVELFNVDNTLDARGGGCDKYLTSDGVGLRIYDRAEELILNACDAGGAGNVHNYAEFSAGLTGPVYIQVIPNETTVAGDYSLRVLPKHDEPGADWDSATYEPNNSMWNAYPIMPGGDNALSSTIEQRNLAYNTFTVDRDWYHFEAVAGRTYVVELFAVDNTLEARGGVCDKYLTSDGVGLRIYDQAEELILNACDAGGAGNVHNYAEFSAGLTGPIYIQVIPNETTVAGDYSLRVLPKHDEPGADWDGATYEPNNSIWNAYPITLGGDNALNSTIEQRNLAYNTFTVDRDWYHFEAVAGRTYVVELFNVDDTLEVRGSVCNIHLTNDGVGLRIYDQTGENVDSDCDSDGAGSVHNTITFLAGLNGTSYIQVIPNTTTATGSYSIRACEDTCKLFVYLPLIMR